MYQETNWEEINKRKRLEIMVGQAANLANEYCTSTPSFTLNDDRMLQRAFDFYFAFLQKQYDRAFPKPKRELNRREIFKKKMDEQHLEIMNEEND